MLELSPGNADPDEAAELRTAPRISLVLRAAKLLCPLGEFLCILRDVSASGIKARLFHQLPDLQSFELELGNGERFRVELVWQRDDHAGFQFLGGEVDLARLIDEGGPFPKRQLRLKLDLPIDVCSNGAVVVGRLHDLSQHGALIELDRALALRQLVRVSGSALPSRHARVRWRRGKAHGLVFHEGFRLDELAQLVAALQGLKQPGRESSLVNY